MVSFLCRDVNELRVKFVLPTSSARVQLYAIFFLRIAMICDKNQGGDKKVAGNDI